MSSKHLQRSVPTKKGISQIESAMIEKEVEVVLSKGVITSVNQEEDHFLSTLFLLPKKDGNERPVIDLKHLNQFIPYQHFQMEGLNCPKEVLLKGNYIYKVGLKDTYFCVPLNKKSLKHVRFLWLSNFKN